MPTLHYGNKTFVLEDAAVLQLGTDIASKVADDSGGWVSFTDAAGQDWSIIVTSGIPIFIDAG